MGGLFEHRHDVILSVPSPGLILLFGAPNATGTPSYISASAVEAWDPSVPGSTSQGGVDSWEQSPTPSSNLNYSRWQDDFYLAGLGD